MRIFYIFLVLSFSFLSPASPSVPFWQSSLLAPSSSPVVAQKISLQGVPNAGKVSDSLFRGAQPDLSNLNELKKLGVTTIVDLRSESRHTRDLEQRQAESLGIHFISIPVDGFSPPTSDAACGIFHCSSPSSCTESFRSLPVRRRPHRSLRRRLSHRVRSLDIRSGLNGNAVFWLQSPLASRHGQLRTVSSRPRSLRSNFEIRSRKLAVRAVSLASSHVLLLQYFRTS